MSTLHLIFSQAGADACLDRSRPDDKFLLLQDGVYVRHFPAAKVLDEHAKARGVLTFVRAEQLINWDEFVSLTTTHAPVVSWR